MSFERWDKFLHDTIKDKYLTPQGSRTPPKTETEGHQEHEQKKAEIHG